MPRILVDGRSGSGKTEFALALAAAAPLAQLVRLDDIYPGWDGLAAGERHVVENVLGEFRWQRFDWTDERSAEWHELDPTRPIIVEGCGTLSRAARALATFGVWVELDAGTRRERAIARDGASYESHWERWARQEDEFIARENPRSIADGVLVGDDVTVDRDGWIQRMGLDRWARG